MISTVDSATYTPQAPASEPATTVPTQPTTTPANTTPGSITEISNNLKTAITQAESSSTDEALNKTLGTISAMLQNLMTMIQNLFAGMGNTTPTPGGSNNNNNQNPGGSNPTPGNGQFLYGPPPKEPPTIVPLDNNGGTTQTQGNGSTGTTNQGQTNGTQGTGGAAPTKRTRKKGRKGRTKGAKGSKGSKLKGRGEFLWKPKSEKDGKLAILIPKAYTGQVESVKILAPDGSTVAAEGKPAGVGNESREHFRFNKAGEAFEDGSIVLVTLKDGSTLQIPIKETSKRFTK